MRNFLLLMNLDVFHCGKPSSLQILFMRKSLAWTCSGPLRQHFTEVKRLLQGKKKSVYLDVLHLFLYCFNFSVKCLGRNFCFTWVISGFMAKMSL